MVPEKNDQKSIANRTAARELPGWKKAFMRQEDELTLLNENVHMSHHQIQFYAWKHHKSWEMRENVMPTSRAK